MKILPPLALATLTAALAMNAVAADFWVSSLEVRTIQDWGEPGRDLTIDGKTITIAGKTFERGVGTHANSTMRIGLGGTAEKFTADVGLDDEAEGNVGTINFIVIGDGKNLWESGVMRRGEPAKNVSVDLQGVRTLVLTVSDTGDGINWDHADWANAKIVMNEGAPRMLPPTNLPPMGILTPKPQPAPRINGPKVFGVRPGNPFLFTIAATGERPMTYAVDKLPRGLKLDAKTGIITGVIKDKGEFKVTLHAKNSRGEAKREFKIVCGPLIGLTP